MRARTVLVLAAMAATVPVVAMAPAGSKVGGARSIDELVAPLRESGLSGTDLANAAIGAVAREYTYYSAWHLWELPETSLARGRGWSHQYNTVLLEVLRRLGFEAGLVHAARMHRGRRPWFHAGHTWVKVTIDGRRHDACASHATNRLDDMRWVPATEELPFHDLTRVGMALAYTPFLTATVWRAWLTGRPVPAWLYRPRA